MMHSTRFDRCCVHQRAVRRTKDFFSFNRKSLHGKSIPDWLLTNKSVLLRSLLEARAILLASSSIYLMLILDMHSFDTRMAENLLFRLLISRHIHNSHHHYLKRLQYLRKHPSSLRRSIQEYQQCKNSKRKIRWKNGRNLVPISPQPRRHHMKSRSPLDPD